MRCDVRRSRCGERGWEPAAAAAHRDGGSSANLAEGTESAPSRPAARRRPLVLPALALMAAVMLPLAILLSGGLGDSAGGARTLGAHMLQTGDIGEAGIGTAALSARARAAALAGMIVPAVGTGSSILMQGRLAGRPVPPAGWIADNAHNSGTKNWREDLRRDQLRVARKQKAKEALQKRITGAVPDATAAGERDVASAAGNGGATSTLGPHTMHKLPLAGSLARANAAAARPSPWAKAAAKQASDVAHIEPLIPSKLSKELTHVISQIVQKAAVNAASDEGTMDKPPGTDSEYGVTRPAMMHGSMKRSVPALSSGDTAVVAAVAGEPVPDPLASADKFLSTTTQGNLDEGLINATSDATRASVGGSGSGNDESMGWLAYKRIPLTYAAFLCAALCVVITMLLSTKLILQHLDYYANPDTQKYVVRILFIAPIYAVDSLLALTFVGWATTYIDVFRDCYEAFTIYNFLKLLIVLLGGERAAIEMLEKRSQMPLIFPLHWMDPWEMGAELFYSCKYGALQYVLIKPTCALVMFVSGAAGIYGPNSFSLARLHFYVFFFSNISQMWALYCLVMFYVVLREELAPYNPVLKFVIVKAVVFFCFWQGMLLGVLAYMGYIRGTAEFDSAQIVEAIQELLVCVEMVIVSFLFATAFPVQEFVDVASLENARSKDPAASEKKNRWKNAADPFRIHDIREDMAVYGALQQKQFDATVQATQEGITSVITSARLATTTPRARREGPTSEPSTPTSKAAAAGHELPAAASPPAATWASGSGAVGSKGWDIGIDIPDNR